MFKKYFILLFVFTSFVFLNNRASAASSLIKDPGVDPCTSKLINATATNIISEVDLSMSIDVCVVTNSNPPFTLNETNIQSGFFATKTIDTNIGTTTIPMPYTFQKTSIKGSEAIKYTISDNSNPALTDTATIDAYVDITPIDLSNNKSLADNGTLGVGQSITFTCKNATELYYDPVAGQTNTPVVSDYTGASTYTLVYTVTPDPGDHTIECDNIDGADTRQIFNFHSDNNKLDINNPTYSPTEALSPVHFTWDSNGTNCSLYNYDKSVSYGNATGNSSSGFVFDLNSPDYPLGANTYGYYIKCYDSNYPGSVINDKNPNLTSSKQSINGVNTTMAWYHLVIPFTCPDGYLVDSANGNACVPPDPPTCSFTDPSTTAISCTCPNTTLTSVTVNSTDGSSQSITPPSASFAWNNLQYRYQISCNRFKFTYPALRRPYSHFLSFNVSAGYVKPGGDVDMNWVIQDPTTTCKIIGIDLKTGQEIFNSTGGNYGPVNTSITVSKSSSLTKDFTTGSLKGLMGKALTVNNPSRFTASCDNNSLYKPGHYQLVRDVYTTTSQEK